MAKKKHNSKSRNTARNGIAAGSTKGLDAFAKAAFQEQVHQFQNRGTSISDIFEGLDFDHFHIKRRISSVLALVDDVCQHVNSLCPDVPDCFSIAEDWITINAFPVSAYDYVENQICSALGAAIWILDNIRDQGKIQELTAILDSAELPPPANLPPVWDACHSQQLLATMVSIINHRNADCPLQKKQSAKDSDAMFRCYMDRCSAEGKIDPDVPSRILFNRIVDLLDPAELSRIKTCYIEKFWDWLHRYYQCRAVFVREEMGIRGEIEAFHATAQQIAGAPAPQISVPMADHKNLLSQQEYQQRMLQLKELDQKNGILYIRQEDFNKRFEIFFREVGEFSMLPLPSVMARKSLRFGLASKLPSHTPCALPSSCFWTRVLIYPGATSPESTCNPTMYPCFPGLARNT